MAAPPILLVADDLSVIAGVKRVLAREGYECILATSAADAIIAWGHALPGLVLLQPSVESERGAVVLEELQLHPDAQLLKVVLLGETVPGFPWPVEPLPLDGAHFVETIEDNIRSGTNQGTGWAVLETTAPAAAPAPAVDAGEPETWRATMPGEVDRDAAQGEVVPEPTAIVAAPTPPSALEDRLFGDLAADVEAQAMQSVESSLNLPPTEDEELQRLEDEVRAEAQRRRQSREAHAVEVKRAPPTPPELPAQAAGESGEASFGELAEAPQLPPSRAAEVLGRAEQMVLETRAQAEAHRRAEDADARRQQGELEAATRRAQHAEELVRAEREARGLGDDELFALRDELKRLSAEAENERELARVRHENTLEELEAARLSVRERADAEGRVRAEHDRVGEALRQQVRALEVALEAASRQVAEAKQSPSGTADELGRRDAALAESGARLAQLELVAQTAVEAQQQRRDLEAQLAESGARLAQLELVAQTAVEAQQQRQALEAQLAESGARLAQLEFVAQTAVEAQQQRRDLEAQLAESGARLAQLELVAQGGVEAQQQRQALEAQLAESGARLAQLELVAQTAVEEQQKRHAVEARLAEAEQNAAADFTEAGARAAQLEHLAQSALEQQYALEARLTEVEQRAAAERRDFEARLAASGGDAQRQQQLEARLVEVEKTAAAERQALETQFAEVARVAAAERQARLAEVSIEARARQALEAQLAEVERVAAAERQARLAEVSIEERARQALEARLTAAEQAASERQALEAQLADVAQTAATERQGLEARLAEAGARLAQLELVAKTAVEAETQVRELTDSLETAREEAAATVTLAADLEAERARVLELRASLEVAEQHLAEVRTARDEAQTEMLALDEERERLQAQLKELSAQLAHAQADATSATALLDESAREQDVLRAKLASLAPLPALAERLQAELDTERSVRREAEARLTETATTLESTRTQAEELEATAQLAAEKVKALEAREVMSLTLPGRGPVGVARHGNVDLEGLARVVCDLVLTNAEVKLELGTAGGTRSLWFKRGQIIAAESTFDAEGLIGRARRDGLIDARQDGELRMLKGATPREQLDALKARAFIRDIESVPLVQRYTEQVALDAFTEEQTLYRIAEEAPKPEVLLATVPRPTLPMLAESLRRAVTPDVMLERLGGGEAVPVSTDSELDLRALGFSERERKMLGWVDAEATIEDLSLASGLKPDVAFRALLVAKLLGVIEVKAGTKKAEPTSGQLDVQRLEAKYDEVQDADYFAILGLSRAAGSEDVRRAFQRLSQEFDPLRYSGHPDAALQQRAQVVANLLEEAARALEDDRRRVEYARHLLD